jgi:predicted nucleotidyltransferase
MSATAEQMRMALDLKEAILKAYDPEAIILFGSLGRGDGDEFSFRCKGP